MINLYNLVVIIVVVFVHYEICWCILKHFVFTVALSSIRFEIHCLSLDLKFMSVFLCLSFMDSLFIVCLCLIFGLTSVDFVKIDEIWLLFITVCHSDTPLLLSLSLSLSVS